MCDQIVVPQRPCETRESIDRNRDHHQYGNAAQTDRHAVTEQTHPNAGEIVRPAELQVHPDRHEHADAQIARRQRHDKVIRRRSQPLEAVHRDEDERIADQDHRREEEH